MSQIVDKTQFKAPKENNGAFFVCKKMVLLAKNTNL